jgi:hypothetical protein
MPLAGYKPAIPATKLRTYTLDRAATGISKNTYLTVKKLFTLL